MQRKTKRSVQFEVTDQTRSSIRNLITSYNLNPDDYLFPSRLSSSPHLSTRQYAKIVKDWVSGIGLDPYSYGTHSLRRTKATLIYRRTKCTADVNVTGGTIDANISGGSVTVDNIDTNPVPVSGSVTVDSFPGQQGVLVYGGVMTPVTKAYYDRLTLDAGEHFEHYF